jgi:hypothetical protein
MPQRRWFNNRLPQTLSIAQFLLYFNAFCAVRLTLLGRVLAVAGVATNLYGGWGIANELKKGYQVALLAAFLPILSRVVLAWQAGSVLGNLGFVLLGGNVINAMFQYALIGLLLHPMSKEHQKIWFT